MNLPLLITKTLQTLQDAGYEAYVVGGSVRDLLLNKPVTDWDFTTNATPEQIQAVFPESFYENQFGTVGLTVEELLKQSGIPEYDPTQDQLNPHHVFEITTYRTEGEYSDNRRPDQVSWGQTLEEDLQRRDFTINALALTVREGLKPSPTPTPIIIDLYNGQADLQNRQIRAVGDPDQRFTEDALRLLRAVRLAAQLGFLIEPTTLAAMTRESARLANISWERKRDELLKLLVAPYVADGLKLLRSTNLLQFVLPEMVQAVDVEQGGHHTKDVWHHSIDAVAACPSPDPIVRLATLLHDVGKPIAYRRMGNKITFYGHEVVGGRMVKKIGARLHLSNRDQERLFKLVRYHMFAYNPEMTDASIRRFIRNVDLENVNDMIMLRIGDRVGGGSKQTSWRLREFQERIGKVLYTPMQIKDLNVNGNDVMEILGVQGGPIVGQILKTLFEEVLEDSDKNEREYLLGRIKELGISK